MQSSKFASYFGGISHALSARDYRIYWYAHVFSSHGVWMHRMAVGVLIFQLTDSPAWLGFIGFVYSLPLMLLGPIAGAIADRFGIRRTAIIAIVITIALTCLMAGLTLGRVMTPALLAAFVIVLGSVHAFDFPVRQVLILLLVGRDRMAAAIALNSTTFYTASFTGPILAAGVLALGNPYVGDAAPGIVFVIYGLTMAALLFAILETRMRDREPEEGNSTNFVKDVLDGLRYTLANDGTRHVLVLSLCVALFARPYMDLLPGYALAVFDHGTDGVGTMFAASGIGALCFSVFMALRGRTEGLTKLLIVSSAVASIALLLYAVLRRGIHRPAAIRGFAQFPARRHFHGVRWRRPRRGRNCVAIADSTCHEQRISGPRDQRVFRAHLRRPSDRRSRYGLDRRVRRVPRVVRVRRGAVAFDRARHRAPPLAASGGPRRTRSRVLATASHRISNR